MSGGRLIQNLRGGRALIVAEQDASTGALVATLARLGIAPVYVRSDSVELETTQLDPERDVLLVDGDLAACPILPLSPLAQLPPVPVVGLVGIEAPSQLRRLMTLGATAFLRKPVHHGSIYSALFLCVNEYHRRMSLERQLQDLQHRRARRRYVIKAVLEIMQRSGVDDDTAYEQLRRDSMRSRQSLEEYCEAHMLRSAEAQSGEAPCPVARTPDKEKNNAPPNATQANLGGDPGRTVADHPGLASGEGGRSDQARRA
jgi:AmiR/NasT family two-component response regulator